MPAQRLGAFRLNMAKTGATQLLLFAPSLILSIAGAHYLNVSDYAGWVLLFSAGTAAIVVDGGASQLAQVHRAEQRLGRPDLARLLLLAAIAPIIFTCVALLLWPLVEQGFLTDGVSHGRILAIAVGAATVVRSWQNVLNGVAIADGDHARRARSAGYAGVAQLIVMLLLFKLRSPFVLAGAYGLGAVVGVLTLARCVAELPRRGLSPARPDLRLRTISAVLSVSLTQGDRFLVAAFGSPAGLVAYDLAARIVATGKLSCVVLAAGMTSEGARGTQNGTSSSGNLRIAQRFVDRVTGAVLGISPVIVLVVTLVVRPELAPTAALVALALAVGHGLHATTAPITLFLSGRRRLRPEVTYLSIAIVVTLVTALVVGPEWHEIGVAFATALGLIVGSLWLRARPITRLLPPSPVPAS